MNPNRIMITGGSHPERKDLRLALEFDGYAVTEAETADRAIDTACSEPCHVLILDSRLQDGLTVSAVCRAIRPNSDMGIIVINHDSDETSPIDLLNAGADDYVPAPYVMGELLARVRALLRRATRSSDEGRSITLDDRAIDLRAHKIKGPAGRVSHLTPKEFQVLQCLVAHANKPRTHQSLAQTVWQRDGRGEVEYVRIVIKQLRRKLEPDPENPRYIVTERSVGYRFHMPPLATRSSETRQSAGA